jgi:hypothetical protein
MYTASEGERGLLGFLSFVSINRRQISGGGAKIRDKVARYPESVWRQSTELAPY